MMTFCPAWSARMETELELAEFDRIERQPGGSKFPQLVHFKNGMKAVFKSTQYNFQNELLAYKVNRILGFDMVPPTIERTFHETGSLQLFVESKPVELHYSDFVTEGTKKHIRFIPTGPMKPRNANHLSFCKQSVFDFLIANPDRSPDSGNYLIHESGNIISIDHEAAFVRDGRAPFQKCKRDMETFVSSDETQGFIESLKVGRENLELRTVLETTLDADCVLQFYNRFDTFLEYSEFFRSMKTRLD